jgi:hypothetical protein
MRYPYGLSEACLLEHATKTILHFWSFSHRVKNAENENIVSQVSQVNGYPPRSEAFGGSCGYRQNERRAYSDEWVSGSLNRH